MRAIDADALTEIIHGMYAEGDDPSTYHVDAEGDTLIGKFAVVDAIFNMPTIQPEPHWIPVTERLPEEEGEYLVTSVYQYYRDGRKTYKTTVDRWSRNGAGKEWVATSNDAHIAWMPLPEPYKGVTT